MAAGINHYFGPDISGNPYANALNQYVNTYSIPEFKNCKVTEAWNDMVVSPLSLKAGGGVAEPAFIKRRDNGLGSIGLYMLVFEKVKTESSFFQIQLPHTYMEGTDIYPHIHFGCPTAAPGTFIHMQFEYIFDPPYGPPINTSTVDDILIPAPTPMTHTIASFAPMSGTGKKISSIISGRISRIIDAQDTYPDGLTLISFDVHHQVDAFGSLEQFTKGY